MHRLSAILSADVAGYSRLMAEDEQATVRAITLHRDEIGRLVGEHHGRLVDATGDNALAEFGSAIEAVRCAIEIQRASREHNDALDPARRMEFRIGVHLGDVAVDGERIYGDGVNIAARLEGLAQAGGICVSAAVREQVASKLELEWQDLGDQTIKNLPRPVHVFRILMSAAPVITERGALSDGPSIVVLPFANMSSDPEQEYFCDGMAEETINALAQLENLNVVARTSAFSFKGRDIDVREIGRRLGVRSVLEGSVRKAGRRLRVTAQLIEVATGYQLWSERFDRELDDVFRIQEEIALIIARRLRAEPAATPGQHTTDDLGAYDAYLRGRFSAAQGNVAGYEASVAHYERALDLDPRFGSAYVGLAEALSYWAFFSASQVYYERASVAVEKAMELGADAATTYRALAFVKFFGEWDWSAAIEAAERALALNPGLMTCHHAPIDDHDQPGSV